MPMNGTDGLAMHNRGEMPSGVYMGMQPIVDREGCVCAHRLRGLTGLFSYAALANDALIDTSAIGGVIGKTEMCPEQSGTPVFVDAGSELLFSDALEKVAAGTVILMVLESARQAPGCVERCRYLHSIGYTLLLDESSLAVVDEPLRDVVGVVGFDLGARTLADIETACQGIKRKGRDIRYLATNVEDREQYVRLREWGFDFFEGYFFARPDAEGLALNRSPVRLILHSLDVLIEEDEHRIERFLLDHPSLFAELLAEANALSSCEAQRPMAMVDLAGTPYLTAPIISYAQLRHWLLVVLLARNLSGERRALVQLLVGRACFIADLARDTDLDADDAFLVGLLSLADTLLDLPASDIVDQLNLHEALAEALLFRRGRFGELLALCEFLEGYRHIDEARDYPGLACTFSAFGQQRLIEAKSKAMFLASRLRFK